MNSYLFLGVKLVLSLSLKYIWYSEFIINKIVNKFKDNKTVNNRELLIIDKLNLHLVFHLSQCYFIQLKSYWP